MQPNAPFASNALSASAAGGVKVCCVGSCNLDLVTFVKKMPQIGETQHGTKFVTNCGGKGANQAVMAAKLGAQVSMVGKVGKDGFGDRMAANFLTHKIDVGSLLRSSGATSSGVATIYVDEAGHNAITIVDGANFELTPEEVASAAHLITASRVLLCQLEVPVPATVEALRQARQGGVVTIMNPAPALPDLPAELLQLSDFFCPNETEASLLTGLPVDTDAQVEAAARALLQRGCKNVLITLGSRGVALMSDSTPFEIIPAPSVRAVDTSGAGDSFLGSLAVYLGAGMEVREAIRAANHNAAISVQFEGTQPSYPWAEGVQNSL
eukprot:gnl/Hemi2/28866_TR9576_c0_g1_i1.p1 gnl/Hemi2/28866_TR9576_c0_g1~~gnl/Hemi2/28866_TR9576_c0_g1_i1.p1  ORF type:complete len:335 (+),score=91.78 gnl/Hemi2/28866_TR9576_c0_g1_i1:35-1006(+)